MSGENTRLPKSRHDEILQQEILSEPKYARVSGGHQSPRAIILAGQPGAGKGGLVDAAKTEFNGDVATIDPDKLRRYHPQVEDLRRQHPYTWSGDTLREASQWAHELRADAVLQRKHLVIDTTTPKASLIRELQRQGYE